MATQLRLKIKIGFKMRKSIIVLMAGLSMAPSGASASEKLGLMVSQNTYGGPGLIDLPSAELFPDAQLSFGISHFTSENRNLINFQFHPKLSLGFRYSRVRDFFSSGRDLFDRSFSVQYEISEESEFGPGAAIGINDALGTGVFSSEYIVFTKTFGETVRLSAGVGFGRLAGRTDFKNPFSFLNKSFSERPALNFDKGGNVQFRQLFRGDGAFFGGIDWKVSDRISVIAEYSPDIYPTSGKTFEQKSPLNFGIRYLGRQGYTLSGYYLYGAEVGLMASTYLNPKEPVFSSGLDPAPPAVMASNTISDDMLGWDSSSDVEVGTAKLAEAMKQQKLTLARFDIIGDTAYVEVLRTSYSRPAQVVGRTARTMTRMMPQEIKTFVIALTSTGVKGAEIVLDRKSLEVNENHYDGSWRSYIAADFQEPELETRTKIREDSLDRDLNVTPYIKSSYFDPNDPYRADLGVQVRGTYEFTEGSYLQGILRQRIFGTLSESTRVSNSVLPRVRSESNLYDKNGNLLLTEFSYNFRSQISSSVFSRVTIGYLEPAFAGMSAEVLWKPFDERYGVGLEINYVNQREFNQRFGLREYKVASGHLSFYYDVGSGYHGQLDLGRYLAGDWGGTLSLARELENGWRIGAFATLTDVSFEEFGEGSFDKGLQISIPTNIATGEPTSNIYSTTLRPIMRDGGARLNVSGRLYGAVRELQKPELADSWGRFWK